METPSGLERSLTTYYLKNKEFITLNITSIDSDTVTPL